MKGVPPEVHGNGRFVRNRRHFVPAYLKTYEAGRLREKVEEALSLLASCTICPRNCHVDRLEDRQGMCRVGRYARVSSFFPHFGEEDVLRGWKGSGTIFFSWCNLRCVFCQNFETSQIGAGEEVTPQELARMMIRLQEMGCHNINFVTPEHVVPQILEALPYAIDMGLLLPLVYNTSAYDNLDSIWLMDGVVDIYMPDFKLWDSENCRQYVLARDYAAAARAVVKAMHQQVGELQVDQQGLALRGVLVRHLVMPGVLDDAQHIMHYLATALSGDTYVNIMDQYYPAWRVTRDAKYAEIGRRIWPEELQRAFHDARAAGLWRFDTRWRRRVGLLRVSA
jgi:putative pyruvate formate lyase activating enzyme